MSTMRERVRRLWSRIPRIVWGSPEVAERPASPVTTYYMVIVPALVLTAFGLLMGFSAQAVTNIAKGENPYLAYLRPLAIMIAALALAYIVHKIPQRVIQSSAVAMFLAGLAVQSLVLTPLGQSEGGNANWVYIPGIPFLVQPSEFIKLAPVLVIAVRIKTFRRQTGDLKEMALHVGLPIVAALGFVMFGRDMGTAMIVAAAAMGAAWAGGLPKKWFVVLVFFAVPLLAVLVFSNPTRLRRVLAILPGNADVRDLSAPEQIDHSLWALGSGGVTGLGPGASREKWNYLQAAHTDFILAIIGEELGLIGTLTVLAAVGLLVWGMIRVSRESDDVFVTVASVGVATWIGAQAVINVFSVTGIGPVIGVPLPLVSYGGSSFLFTAVAVGVVASFARAAAGMRMWGTAGAETAERDPRIAPKRKRAGGKKPKTL